MSEHKLKCLAIDDEPMALDLITDYINSTPFLTLSAAYNNPIEALSFIQSNEIDLLFIDINMPGLSGIQFLKSLNKKPLSILTTAYSSYALEGYELNVVDYLLKPIEFDRFLIAANKAFRQFRLENRSPVVPSASSLELVQIKSGTKTYQIKVGEILYIEAAGNYSTVCTSDKKLMTLLNMADMLKLLPESLFVRIHRSYIISLNHVSVVEKHQVSINEKSIPISQTFRNSFFEKFGGKEK